MDKNIDSILFWLRDNQLKKIVGKDIKNNFLNSKLLNFNNKSVIDLDNLDELFSILITNRNESKDLMDKLDLYEKSLNNYGHDYTEYIDKYIEIDTEFKEKILKMYEKAQFNTDIVSEFIDHINYQYGSNDELIDLLIQGCANPYNFRSIKNRLKIFFNTFYELESILKELDGALSRYSYYNHGQDYYKYLDFDIKVGPISGDINDDVETSYELEQEYLAMELENYINWIKEKCRDERFDLVSYQQRCRSGGQLVLKFDWLNHPKLLEEILENHIYEADNFEVFTLDIMKIIEDINRQIDFIFEIAHEKNLRINKIEKSGLVNFINANNNS